MGAPVPEIDYKEIAFPSGKLTLDQLIHADSGRTNRILEWYQQPAFSEMVYLERKIAKLGFNSALKIEIQPDEEVMAVESRSAIRRIAQLGGGGSLATKNGSAHPVSAVDVQALALIYAKYGLTNGLEQTKRFAADIFAQGATQARQKTGTTLQIYSPG